MANDYGGVQENEFLLSRLRCEEDEILYRIQTVRDRMGDYDKRIEEYTQQRTQRAKNEPYGWLMTAVIITVPGFVLLISQRFVGAGICLCIAVVLWLRALSEHRHVQRTTASQDSAIARQVKARTEASDELCRLRTELSAVREHIAKLSNKQR